ncbi:MAG: hypothetical protein R6W67_09365 [Bacteroidales bacterium]
MDHLSIDKFKDMARINKPYCISIFIPTHRAGKEVIEMIDQKNLKNQIKKVRSDLYSSQVDKDTADELLKPIEELVKDNGFWKHQSDGLAIFRNLDQFIYFTIPVYFDSFIYIKDHFYLKPLLPYINDDDKFYLLALSLGGVKLYEGFPHRIDEFETEDLLPGKPEEVLGYDFTEKNLQFRTGQTGGNQAMFHGHGGGKDEKKMETLKYFRAIHEGVMQILEDKDVPMILAAVDYLVPLYREVSDYKYLEEKFVSGNPEHEDPVLLHEKAREILKGYFNRKRTEKVLAFEQALSDIKASYKPEEIIPAAINQRVDTLFIRNLSELWGMFDQDTNEIIIRDEGNGENSSLLNLAAVHTILNNGSVYLMDADKMPEPGSILNAIFRF